MWKWLVSFIIVALAIVSVTYEQHHAREKYQAQAQADCVALAISPQEKHSCAKEAQSRKNYSPWQDELVTWPEGVTTWAIIITGFFIAWQAWETRKAAEASLLQANHIVGSERAWMIPRISQPEHNDVMFPDEKGDDWKLPIQVEITNLGKTPAVAINAAFNYYSVEIADATGQTLVLDLPESLAYSHEPTPYAPGAIYVSGEATNLPLGIPKSFLLAERDAWEQGKKCLCLRGYIQYLDAFKNRHITRFCYAYQRVWALKAMRYEIRNERGPESEFRKTKPDIFNEMT